MTGAAATSSSNTVLQERLKVLAAIACARSRLRSPDCIADVVRLTSRYRLPLSSPHARASCEAVEIDPTDILGPAATPKTP